MAISQSLLCWNSDSFVLWSSSEHRWFCLGVGWPSIKLTFIFALKLGIIPKERPKTLTVRDVKRQSEQRREREKIRKEIDDMESEGITAVVCPWVCITQAIM